MTTKDKAMRLQSESHQEMMEFKSANLGTLISQLRELEKEADETDGADITEAINRYMKSKEETDGLLGMLKMMGKIMDQPSKED